MTAITLTTTSNETRTRSNRHLVRHGVIAGAGAAAATTGFAAAADAIGVPVAIGGESIPLLAFAQLTLFATTIGVVMAGVMARRAAQPQRMFVRTAVALTVLSFIPDALADAQTSTKLTLMLTHVVAAAIVIPALASRLAD